MGVMQKTIIAIALLVVFNAVIFTFIIHPAIVDIQAFNDRIQIERVALENKYASRRNIKNIIADLKYASDGIVPLEEKMVVKKGQEVSFVSGLEKIAGKNNLAQKIQIVPMAATDMETKNAVIKQKISIALSGDYIDVLKYVSDLEKSSAYIIIDSVNMDSGGVETNANIVSTGNIKAYLEGYVYFSI